MTAMRDPAGKKQAARKGRGAPKAASVSFQLHAPAATSVAIAGDFNGWDHVADPLTRDRDGVWRATLRLAPGVVRYKFVVDGTTWLEDPANPHREVSPLGTYNSVIEVA